MTGFQSLLNRGSAFLEEADPELVSIAGFPGPLPANVGSIFRKRIYTDTGWRSQVRGTVEIRREVLARLAPGLDEPASETEITVRGKTYRIDFTTGDTTSLHIEFAAFS